VLGELDSLKLRQVNVAAFTETGDVHESGGQSEIEEFSKSDRPTSRCLIENSA